MKRCPNALNVAVTHRVKEVLNTVKKRMSYATAVHTRVCQCDFMICAV